jgi:hypothetical protein
MIYKIDVGMPLPPVVPDMTLWGGIAMTVALGMLVVYMVRRRQTA